MSDLINRDVALEIVERTSGNYAAAWSMIRKLPAADAEPVLHGRNVYLGNPVDGFICSECGFHTEDVSRTVYDDDGDYFYQVEYIFKHCPNCGAKMDGGAENDG